tara:strand:+ start:504 stop:836 length:333 start_codon:yes stop_codon:yes gene_type:complete
MRYKNKLSFNERQTTSGEILEKYNNRKPIIIYYDEKQINYKFLMLNSHTISILLLNLRKRLNLGKEDSIFLFINKSVIPSPTDNILNLYNKYKDDDGYLYFDVKKENTFG